MNRQHPSRDDDARAFLRQVLTGAETPGSGALGFTDQLLLLTALLTHLLARRFPELPGEAAATGWCRRAAERVMLDGKPADPALLLALLHLRDDPDAATSWRPTTATTHMLYLAGRIYADLDPAEHPLHVVIETALIDARPHLSTPPDHRRENPR